MKKFDTKVQNLKYKVLREVAREAWKDTMLENVFDILVQKENKICFIKAWNEWGEGNHLEPDLKYGLDFLKTLKQV